jgi:GGDEF domain-containing protein
LISSLVFSSLIVFVYSSYTIFLNIARSIPIEGEVYFWVCAIPLFTILSGYRGQLIKGLQDENARLKKDNTDLVSIDRETGLKNTQLFFDELQAHMNISRRYDIKVYLMLIEVQYKSEIIRAFGRNKYNDIVKELSSLLDGFLRYEDKKFFLRESDRFGVVFLSKPEGGREVKKRVKKTLDTFEFKSEGALNKIYFQASVGMAEYDPNTNINPYEFLGLAEKDMEYDV